MGRQNLFIFFWFSLSLSNIRTLFSSFSVFYKDVRGKTKKCGYVNRMIKITMYENVWRVIRNFKEKAKKKKSRIPLSFIWNVRILMPLYVLLISYIFHSTWTKCSSMMPSCTCAFLFIFPICFEFSNFVPPFYLYFFLFWFRFSFFSWAAWASKLFCVVNKFLKWWTRNSQSTMRRK